MPPVSREPRWPRLLRFVLLVLADTVAVFISLPRLSGFCGFEAVAALAFSGVGLVLGAAVSLGKRGLGPLAAFAAALPASGPILSLLFLDALRHGEDYWVTFAVLSFAWAPMFVWLGLAQAAGSAACLWIRRRIQQADVGD